MAVARMNCSGVANVRREREVIWWVLSAHWSNDQTREHLDALRGMFESSAINDYDHTLPQEDHKR
jgi:hypothetical protein